MEYIESSDQGELKGHNPQPGIRFSNRVGQLAQLDYAVEAKTAVKH